MVEERANLTKNEMLVEVLELFWQTIPPIWHANRTLTHQITMDEFNITPAQFHTLRRLSEGIHSVSDLADCMRLSRPNVSRTVDELVERGLVQRRRDPQDRRNILLSLTPKGISSIHTLHEKIGRQIIGRLAILNENEITELRRGLQALQKISGNQENSLKNHEEITQSN